MTTPQDEPATTEQVSAPTVSTAPTSGITTPPAARWWHWDALPHHLGRARTSTVILSVLFLAVFTLYLNVRPDEVPTRTSPAGGTSDVEVPVIPGLPPGTTAPEPSEEPAPTTGAEESEEPDGGSGTPTTSSAPTSSSPRPTEPTTGTTEPTRTSEPADPTGGTTEQGTPAPSTSGAP